MKNEIKKRVDIHCHFFNRKEISLLMLVDIIQLLKNAEIILSTKNTNETNTDKEIKQLTKSVKSSLSFFLTAIKSPESIYKTVKKSEPNHLFAPLMFDLYWLTQSPKTGYSPNNELNIISAITQELDIIMSNLQKLTRDRHITLERRKMVMKLKQNIQTIKHTISKDVQLGLILKTLITDNYAKQEKQITELYHNHQGELFPFYAVDPRRSSNYKLKNGKYDLTPLTNRLTINGGIFTGFKLYTPCGYSPTHPMLMALYAYCEDHKIPITAHCSGSGVTTLANNLHIQGHVYKNGQLMPLCGMWHFEHQELFSRERILEHTERLNHPMLWEHVLNNYPNLHLNLAHFGHLPHTYEWTDYIYTLLNKKDEQGKYWYPNLYTDLACITEKNTLTKLKEKYFSTNKELQSRFLYGSDYYMNLVYLDSMNEYCDNFQSVFNNEELDLISIENPHRFLNTDSLNSYFIMYPNI